MLTKRAMRLELWVFAVLRLRLGDKRRQHAARRTDMSALCSPWGDVLQNCSLPCESAIIEWCLESMLRACARP
jgi:hypothetical protein